jgi:hypothetical protein
MRMMVLFFLTFTAVAAPLLDPKPELAEVLKRFRTEGPKGWSFTQSTHAEGRSMIERYDSAQPEFNRWTLVSEDGRAPNAEAQRRYRDKFSRYTNSSTAPQLSDQIDQASLVVETETAERTTYRGRLKPTEKEDRTAAFLRAVIVWHNATGTIESLVIENTAPFTPSFGVKIEQMKTTMTYSLPEPEQPSLLQSVVTRLRGTAFWIKSIDADMTVAYSAYAPAAASRTNRSGTNP